MRLLVRMFVVLCSWFVATNTEQRTTNQAALQDEPRVKVFNLERSNTSADEDDPCVVPDGSALLFSSNAGGHFDIMISECRRSTNAADAKYLSQAFAPGKRIEELCGRSDDNSPFLLPREPDKSEYVFFASQRDAKNFDIFFARRLKPNEPFQRTAIAGVHAVCTDEDELHPWLVHFPRSRKAAYELYFSRKSKDGWRVGVATGPTSRVFDKVTLLDLPIGFHHPTVSQNGLTMYLQGPLEKERTGVFVSRRPRIGAAWSKPEPLDMINSSAGPKGDQSPSLSRPNGRYLYFASDRPGGKGGLDLYVVAVADLKPGYK